MKAQKPPFPLTPVAQAVKDVIKNIWFEAYAKAMMPKK